MTFPLIWYVAPSINSTDGVGCMNDFHFLVFSKSNLSHLLSWFTLQVFDEFTSQQEVYNECLSSVPQKIVNGVNCTVLAYGQTGTGKTHTMMGEGQGVEMNLRAGSVGAKAAIFEDTTKVDPQKNPHLTEGMITRTVTDIFEEIKKQPKSLQCTVRCSFVELYVEKFYDLLQPSNEGLMLGEGEDGEHTLLGASELCCLEPRDVYALIARGNAYRSMSASQQNIDCNHSHVILSIKVDQVDRLKGTHRSGRLLMLDLAGSEKSSPNSSSRQGNSASAKEGRMVNASLQSLYNMIRAKLMEQGHKEMLAPNAFAYVSKLSKLLKSSIGGNCYTTCICTASPSSFGLNETMNTIKYGQKLRLLLNYPKSQKDLTINDYRARLSQSEMKSRNLEQFVTVLAKECERLRETGKSNQSENIWDAISKITKLAESGKDNGAGLKITVSSKDDESNEETGSQSKVLKRELKEQTAAFEKAESVMRDYQSQVVTLKSERELELKARKKLELELSEAKEEIASLSRKTDELKSVLKTSQFREREAVSFLRQFRSFYIRLMEVKAAQGTSDTRQVIEETSKKIPGVPDLDDILDIDKLMLESGLIEKSEAGDVTNASKYNPSEEALARSAAAAEVAEQKEMKLISEMMDAKDESAVKLLEPGQITAYRQRLVETPAARLAMQKESELESQLLELSTKCIALQNAVNAEKAMVEALSTRQNALNNLRTSREMSTLRSELEKRSNDLQAIVWKMNELHLVNKTMTEKIENRDNHLSYLEEHMNDLQTKNQRMVIERQEAEKRLMEDTASLKQVLDGMNVQLWQLGEVPLEKSAYCRVILSCSGDPADLDSEPTHTRKVTVGTISEEALKLLDSPDEESMEVFATKNADKSKPAGTKKAIDEKLRTSPTKSSSFSMDSSSKPKPSFLPKTKDTGAVTTPSSFRAASKSPPRNSWQKASPPAKSTPLPATPKTSAPAENGNNEYYPLADLQAKKVPGIDNSRREQYLSPGDFMTNFKMTKEEFQKLPKWKRDKQKQSLRLF